MIRMKLHLSHFYRSDEEERERRRVRSRDRYESYDRSVWSFVQYKTLSIKSMVVVVTMHIL